jgi:hypothetical protein
VVEHDLRALEVRHDRVHRLLDDQPRADRGGEVVDDVALVHELVHDRAVQNRVDDEVERRFAFRCSTFWIEASRNVRRAPDLPAVRKDSSRGASR